MAVSVFSSCGIGKHPSPRNFIDLILGRSPRAANKWNTSEDSQSGSLLLPFTSEMEISRADLEKEAISGVKATSRDVSWFNTNASLLGSSVVSSPAKSCCRNDSGVVTILVADVPLLFPVDTRAMVLIKTAKKILDRMGSCFHLWWVPVLE